MDTLKRICRDDMEALDALDKALQDGGRQGERNDLAADNLPDNIREVANQADGYGTSRAYSLRRLRSEQPELHARVLAAAPPSIPTAPLPARWG